MQQVVITGIGPILPNCDHRNTFWHHLHKGHSQLAFEPDPGRPDLRAPMGKIRDFDAKRYVRDIPERQFARCTRSQLLYLSSIWRAIDDAGLDPRAIANDRVGLFDGTSRDNFDFWSARVGAQSGNLLTKKDLAYAMPGMSVGMAASMLGIRGPTCTFAGTCTSGAISIGNAFRELALGEIDIAFATGHDAALLGPVYDMYRDANLLSDEQEDARRAVKPYVEHSKNVFGEGAMTLVLETRAHAEARGATIWAELLGYKLGNSGYHPTHIEPQGTRSVELVTALLEKNRISRDEVGFVIGHGNGVEMSDHSEINYMLRVFGDTAPSVPLLSTKPTYGHALGASGAISVAAAALMLHHQYVIPTLNIHPERAHSTGLDHVPGRGRVQASKAGLVVAYGMGGMNVALLLKHAASPTA